MDPVSFPSLNEEKERYLTHNNDPTQEGYQQFVMPIVDRILRDYSTEHLGLDYGAGKSEIITYMLTEQKYQVAAYDPIFKNTNYLLQRGYHYVACCEVVEHFHDPAKEFKRLYNLLVSKGKLYIKTDLYVGSINFQKWYYKDDPTHTFFYSERTMQWIKERYGFKDLNIDGRLVILSK